MSKRDTRVLIEDILQSTQKILVYTEGLSFDDFLKDDKTLDAVVRNFEIIGEASNRVPPDYQNEHPQIEWRRMVGFRNRIIHEYFGIDYEIVWQIIQEHIPYLVNMLCLILEDE